MYALGDTLHFQNIDSDDDELPIRGTWEREVIRDPFDPCLEELEPLSVYIITELYFDTQTIELTYKYFDKWGKPLRDSVILTFDRYGS